MADGRKMQDDSPHRNYGGWQQGEIRSGTSGLAHRADTGSARRVHDFLQIGSHFIIQFRDAKEQPSFLMLHSPSSRLTTHIPSHSEEAGRVSRLPLMCPVLACVTMP